MKIGILTFHRAYNYGAFLQAFATLTFLRSKGYDTHIIDYMPEGHTDFYNFFNSYWKQASLIGKLKILVRKTIDYPISSKRKRKFKQLQERLLGITENVKYTNPLDLKDIDCECVIYGSDQIWWKGKMLAYKGFDAAYWGEYIPKAIKKIAYAPSMGAVDFTKEDVPQLKHWLKNFSALSVREKQLATALSPIAGDIPVVLDPVFFLDKAQWMEKCSHIQSRYKKPYLLLYNLQSSCEAKKKAMQLAHDNDWEIVEINQSYSLDISHRYDRESDPLEFVSLFRDAEFVVTTSFHGTAFSIIFRKPFAVIGLRFAAERIHSILNLLQLNERYRENADEDIDLLIDYSKVEPLLQEARNKSQKYLMDSIKD